MSTKNNKEKKIEGNCSVCNKKTEHYCSSCCETWGEFSPTYFCEEHYNSVVLTGNCCRDNEILYAK